LRTSDMIKSKFWRAADVQGKPPMTLTIADVTEELMGRGGRQETKCFLWFVENLKGLQLNKTRVRTLEAAFGPDSEGWVGKRVRLTFDPTVEFGGRSVGGVGLQTPPGVIYSPSANGHAGWGDAPAQVPGRPPAPVWDEKRQVWVTPQPVAAAAQPPRPPAPVWNEATGQWETVNPATGEIGVNKTSSPRPVKPANPQDSTWGGAPTLSQRVAAPASSDGWDTAAAADFNDDIPF
jgi:hypothetical protein